MHEEDKFMQYLLTQKEVDYLLEFIRINISQKDPFTRIIISGQDALMLHKIIDLPFDDPYYALLPLMDIKEYIKSADYYRRPLFSELDFLNNVLDKLSKLSEDELNHGMLIAYFNLDKQYIGGIIYPHNVYIIYGELFDYPHTQYNLFYGLVPTDIKIDNNHQLTKYDHTVNYSYNGKDCNQFSIIRGHKI